MHEQVFDKRRVCRQFPAQNNDCSSPHNMMMVRRQPLQPTAPNTVAARVSRLEEDDSRQRRDSRIMDQKNPAATSSSSSKMANQIKRAASSSTTPTISSSSKKERSPSRLQAGRENFRQQQTATTEQQQQLPQPPQGISKRSGFSQRRSKSMKMLLGGVLDRLQRTSSSRRLSSSPRSSREELALATTTTTEEQTTCTTTSNHHHPIQRDASASTRKHCVASQNTTVLTDAETVTPLLDDGCYYTDETETEDETSGVNVSVALLQPPKQQLRSVATNSQQRGLLLNRHHRNHVAATRLQSLFRGYRQRYYFSVMKLHHKLQHIEATKQRQLRKLAQRTKVAKKREKSVMEFHQNKQSRRLQRMTHIIPYLFRDAQAKLQENVEWAATTRQLLHHQVLLDLTTSHRTLQRLAHSYLESLEDVSGIWDVLKAQWMAPKKPRPRRGFGPDGKIIRLIVNVDQAKKKYNTHDDDLPVSPSPSYSRKNSDNSISTKDRALAELQYLELYFELLEETPHYNMDAAIEQAEAVILN